MFVLERLSVATFRASVLPLGLACAAVVGACAPAMPEPSANDATMAAKRYPGVTVEDLAAGRTTYVSKCSRCHNLFRPSERSPEAWPAIVKDMGARAKLSADETAAVERYVVTMSERHWDR